MNFSANDMACLVFSLVVALALSGCTTADNHDADDWDLLEPGTTAESDDDPVDDESEEAPEDPEPGEAIDCSQPDPEQWEAEEFAFVVYRYLACQHDDSENILFSPAALRIALGERADNLGGQEGQSIAEKFGYGEIDDFVAETKSYKADLLDRRPVPSRKYGGGSGYWDYEFEEEDPERLRESVGVEFYSIDCGEPPDEDCQWTAQNERWSTDFPGTSPPSVEPTFPSETAAMIFRGQWENPPSGNLNMDFDVPGDDSVEVRRFLYHVNGQVHDHHVSIHKARMVGGEISLIFIQPKGLPLNRLEGELTAKRVHSWIDSINRRAPKPRLRFPRFVLSRNVNITDLLHLQQPIKSSTEIAIDDEGVNSPEELELVTDFDGWRAGGAIPQNFRLEQPFIFLVYDHPTQSILSIARVSNPVGD